MGSEDHIIRTRIRHVTGRLEQDIRCDCGWRVTLRTATESAMNHAADKASNNHRAYDHRHSATPEPNVGEAFPSDATNPGEEPRSSDVKRSASHRSPNSAQKRRGGSRKSRGETQAFTRRDLVPILATAVCAGVITWAAMSTNPTSPNQNEPYVATESSEASTDLPPTVQPGRNRNRPKDAQSRTRTNPKTTHPSREQQFEEQDDSASDGAPEDFCSEQYDLIWDMYRSGDLSRRDFDIQTQEIEDVCIGW